MSVRIINGDCLAVLPQLAAEGVQAHAVVCDPPYGLGFMGKKWDAADNVAFRPETWAAVMTCMRPGAHLIAFGGTRTWHRMAVAIEDAGFEIRDCVMWLYGTGFPKSHDVSKGIDKAAGAVREVVGSNPLASKQTGKQSTNALGDFHGVGDITAPATPEAAAWAGWGTALKPAWESIILASKPLSNKSEWVTMHSTLFQLWSDLWLMLPANVAVEFSTLSPSGFGVDLSAFALCNAEQRSNTLADLCEQMDMSQCVSALLSSLSTVCSWNSTLADRCSRENMSTTEMVSNTTTELRTLRFSLSKITPRTIIQAHKSGAWSNANACPAARYLNATVASWHATHELSVLGSVIEQDRICFLAEGAHPQLEPIILARKPLEGTVAANILAHGTGALNIDACRVGSFTNTTPSGVDRRNASLAEQGYRPNAYQMGETAPNGAPGRWPANVLHDGSDEVEAAFAAFGATGGGGGKGLKPGSVVKRASAAGICTPSQSIGAESRPAGALMTCYDDTGSASRFFYCAKADASDRVGSKHPTVKPTALMRWLVQLVTPPGGLVLDPFAGSGSTGLAADQLGMNAILIEQDATYAEDARRKVASDGGMFSSVAVEDIRDLAPRSLFAEVE